MAAARYWRVSIATTNNALYISFAEVTFLSAARVDLSVGGTALASSAYSADFAAGKAFDKSTAPTSRWCNASNQWPAWIGYDFGAPVEVEYAVLVMDTQASNLDLQLPRGMRDVSMQYSLDGATWHSAGASVWHGGSFVNSATVIIGAVPPERLGMHYDAAGIGAASPLPDAAMPASLRAAVARDVEFGGQGRIWGTNEIQISESQKVPTGGRVVLLHQRSKLPVRETWANPVTGAWAFEGLDTAQDFIALAEDLAGNYRPVAANRLTPEVP